MHSLIGKIEKKLKYRGISDISLYIVIGQAALFFLSQNQTRLLELSLLKSGAVWNGEVWRLITFIFIPPSNNLLLCALGWYMFYFMNRALEDEWGSCKLNIYLGLGYIATVLSGLLLGVPIVNNSLFLGSTFLAFAALNPKYEFLLFFVLPVQVRWIATITLCLYALLCIEGDYYSRVTVLGGLTNYLVFFGQDFIRTISRRSAPKLTNLSKSAIGIRANPAHIHKCEVCGLTDTNNPDAEFRYCSKCKPSLCYCLEHLKDHQNQAH